MDRKSVAAGPSLSVVIVTYGRGQVLIDTIEAVLRLAKGVAAFRELILIDQNPSHREDVSARLAHWSDGGDLCWLRLPEPHLTRAMNVGLSAASSEIVLFLDDDIVPGVELLQGHLGAHQRFPSPAAVVGQVLQPGEVPWTAAYRPSGGGLFRFLDFRFNSSDAGYIETAIACNLSVKRSIAIAAGGFDEAFTPPVASRFETEFVKRLAAAGELIWFEPSASVRHLRSPTGGTRISGSHLGSPLPCFGMGDYYFALRSGRGPERVWYMLRRPFREVRTKYHLRRPWRIPVKLVGEARAILQAVRAYRSPPQLLDVRVVTEMVPAAARRAAARADAHAEIPSSPSSSERS
jgi:GT2 family glycosyltransferase